MLTLNHLYKDAGEFSRFLDGAQFDRSLPCLVKIFTASFGKAEAVATARGIQAVLPNAKVVGATSCGIVFLGTQYENETMVLIERYDTLQVHTAAFTWRGKTARAFAREVADAFAPVGECSVHLILSDHYEDVYGFVEAVNEVAPTLRLAGGVAGDVLPKGIAGFVFTPDGVQEQGAVAFCSYGEAAHCFLGVGLGQEAISPVFTVTGAGDGFIYEIDGTPAVPWFYDYLGINEMKAFEDWQSIADNDHLIRFQMLLEGHGGAGRFVRYDEDAKKMAFYFSRLPAGTQFRIGYTNPSKCVQECSDLCQRVMGVPTERLFSYACLFRKMYLGNCAKWELTPYHEYPVCGLFMMGEIAYLNGRNEYLNGACVLSGLAEHESYILPDSSVFSDLYQIEDEDKSLLRFALSRQQETIHSQNAKLMEQLVRQQELTKIQLYVDQNTGLPNIFQYKEDKKQYGYDKLCMVQVENADLLLAYAGQETYLAGLREIVESIGDYLHKKRYDNKIRLYALNQSVFFYAGKRETDEEFFQHMIHNVYKNFQFAKSVETGLACISRFVLVLHQEDMIESALNTLQANKNSQTHFLVCADTTQLSVSYAGELRVIELLNKVLEQGGVTPYYQGIRDNETKRIMKYEALMRLRDGDGRVYVPFDFMGVAKKYHLYAKLSYSMMEKVLEDFAGRTEEVSINLSPYDMGSSSFQEWFFEKIKSFPDPRRIVIELVETENYIETDGCQGFVRNAKALGMKIAIDDFGSGYSTLSQIVRMEPDYIKVDGSIIRDIIANRNNDIILKTIVFLARQLQVSVIAEFVENEEIQQAVEENGVRFSQGYYFSKPAPLAELSPP